jgi:hypothetical protein
MKSNIATIIFIMGYILIYSQDSESYSQNNDISIKKNSFKIGVGILPITVLPITQSIASIGDFSVGFDNKNFKKKYQYFPTIYIGYFRRINKIVIVNTSFAFDRINARYTNVNPALSFNKIDNLYRILIGSNFYFFDKNRLKMYSGLDIGVTVNTLKYKNFQNNTPNDRTIGFAFQLNALGLEVHGKNCFGFAELGFGSLGFFKIGFGYKF